MKVVYWSQKEYVVDFDDDPFLIVKISEAGFLGQTTYLDSKAADIWFDGKRNTYDALEQSYNKLGGG